MLEGGEEGVEFGERSEVGGPCQIHCLGSDLELTL